MAVDFARVGVFQSRRWFRQAACGLLFFAALLRVGAETNQLVTIWDADVRLREGVGYKDNLLYDARAREHSAFLSTGIEAAVSRFSSSGSAFLTMVDFEDIRYLSGDTVDKEQTLIATVQYQRKGNVWQWALEADYLYQDQMFDSSVTETSLSAVRALGHLVEVRPSIGRSFGAKHHVELQPIGARQLLDAPLDDYWEGGAKLTYGYALHSETDLALCYEYLGRPYDTRGRTDAHGYATGQDGLMFHEHAISLALRHYWDRQHKWRTTTKVLYERNLDNSAGYFNYHRYQFAQGLRFHHRAWDATVQIRMNYYDFDRQTVKSRDSSRRHKLTTSIHARMEYQWTKWLGSYLDYENESSISNMSLDEYGVNTISAGMFLQF